MAGLTLPSGKVLLTMTDLRVAELTNSPRQLAFDELVYEVQWKEDDLRWQRESTPHLFCVLLKDLSDFSDRLVTKLQKLEFNVITVNLPTGSCFEAEAEEVLQRVFEDILSSNSSNLKAINFWPLETSHLQDKLEVIEQAQRLAFGCSVFLMKLLIEKQLIDSRLFLVTERTQL